MSAICIALIFHFLFDILNSKSVWQKIIGSLGGSLSLIASQAFWNFSEISEVYTFQNLFLLLLLLIILVKSNLFNSLSNLRYKYSFAFIYGLSLGAHASMAIFIPAFILYDLVSDKNAFRVKYLAFMLFFAVFGFVIYAYLPFRSISPIVFDWGDPEKFQRFLVQIFDQKDSKSENYYLINLSVFKLKLYIDHLINEFSILLCLIGIIGFLSLLLYQMNIAILLFFILISNIIFFLNAGWTVSWHCTGQKIRIADIVDKYDVLAGRKI